MQKHNHGADRHDVGEEGVDDQSECNDVVEKHLVEVICPLFLDKRMDEEIGGAIANLSLVELQETRSNGVVGVGAEVRILQLVFHVVSFPAEVPREPRLLLHDHVLSDRHPCVVDELEEAVGSFLSAYCSNRFVLFFLADVPEERTRDFVKHQLHN